MCSQSNEINSVINSETVMATSLLYLLSKFQFASVNTCGSLVVRVDRRLFCYSVTKMENNRQQRHEIKF
jgi:hypothetical protein